MIGKIGKKQVEPPQLPLSPAVKISLYGLFIRLKSAAEVSEIAVKNMKDALKKHIEGHRNDERVRRAFRRTQVL